MTIWTIEEFNSAESLLFVLERLLCNRSALAQFSTFLDDERDNWMDCGYCGDLKVDCRCSGGRLSEDYEPYEHDDDDWLFDREK